MSSKLQYDNKNLYKSYTELKDELSTMNEIKIKLSECENLNENLKIEFEDERSKSLNVVRLYNVKLV